MKRHKGVYLYYCPYCNKGINSTTDTKEHIRVHHTGLNGYHCRKCGKEFQHLSDLKSHIDADSCDKVWGNLSKWQKRTFLFVAQIHGSCFQPTAWEVDVQIVLLLCYICFIKYN